MVAPADSSATLILSNLLTVSLEVLLSKPFRFIQSSLVSSLRSSSSKEVRSEEGGEEGGVGEVTASARGEDEGETLTEDAPEEVRDDCSVEGACVIVSVDSSRV